MSLEPSSPELVQYQLAYFYLVPMDCTVPSISGYSFIFQETGLCTLNYFLYPTYLIINNRKECQLICYHFVKTIKPLLFFSSVK